MRPDTTHRDDIPQEGEGASSNNEYTVECENVGEASDIYNTAKRRLLNVNEWHRYGGTGTAKFTLIDANGNTVDRDPEKGDFFQIDIPGPGPSAGDGYDWVQIEEVHEDNSGRVDVEEMYIRVRPAPSPTNSDPNVAHFFSQDASSNFIIQRNGLMVKAAVYGRNEKPNTSVDAANDKVRNAMVGTGAIAGFSKLQWKLLVKGLLTSKD
jgi:hypothetical protein